MSTSYISLSKLPRKNKFHPLKPQRRDFLSNSRIILKLRGPIS